MLKLKDYEKTYWNRNGKYQKFVAGHLEGYEIYFLNAPKMLKSKYSKMAHSYYRFYNDGDRPRHEIFKGKNDKEISEILENEINSIIEQIQENI